jgi:hypothetical protein
MRIELDPPSRRLLISDRAYFSMRRRVEPRDSCRGLVWKGKAAPAVNEDDSIRHVISCLDDFVMSFALRPDA